MRKEYKNLILRHGEATDAASGAAKKAIVREDQLKQMQSEHDRLFKELSEVKGSYDAFCLVRAQEHDKLIAEVRIERSRPRPVLS